MMNVECRSTKLLLPALLWCVIGMTEEGRIDAEHTITDIVVSSSIVYAELLPGGRQHFIRVSTRE